DFTTYADVIAQLHPGQSYTLRVSGDLKDRYGQKLGKPFTQRIVVDDLSATVEIGVSGNTLEPTIARPIAVGSVNVKSYELLTAALSPTDLLALTERGPPENQF